MVPAEVPSAAAEHGSGSPPALLEVVLHDDGLHVRLGAPDPEDLLVSISRGADEAWEDVDVLPAGSVEEVLDVPVGPGDRVRLSSEDGTRVSGTVHVLGPEAADRPGTPEEPPVADPSEAVSALAGALEERHAEWTAHAEGALLHVHGRFGNTFRVAAEALTAGAGDVRAVCAISSRGDFTLLATRGSELLRAEERGDAPLQWHLYVLPSHIDAAALAQNPEAARRYRNPPRGRPDALPDGALALLRGVGVDVSAPLDRCTV
ncbi:hypothetical protein [Kineococcus esterisolvens]|uniref:hypothetical protein n=1 Tax=unclassified Kineococcus TaxID=2621656 RepID=UPI003D7E30D5